MKVVAAILIYDKKISNIRDEYLLNLQKLRKRYEKKIRS